MVIFDLLDSFRGQNRLELHQKPIQPIHPNLRLSNILVINVIKKKRRMSHLMINVTTCKIKH